MQVISNNFHNNLYSWLFSLLFFSCLGVKIPFDCHLHDFLNTLYFCSQWIYGYLDVSIQQHCVWGRDNLSLYHPSFSKSTIQFIALSTCVHIFTLKVRFPLSAGRHFSCYLSNQRICLIKDWDIFHSHRWHHVAVWKSNYWILEGHIDKEIQVVKVKRLSRWGECKYLKSGVGGHNQSIPQNRVPVLYVGATKQMQFITST